jgi:hypothetical protein
MGGIEKGPRRWSFPRHRRGETAGALPVRPEIELIELRHAGSEEALGDTTPTSYRARPH